jgi:photosystem II stability/assembly factor-like uncharacterized protein
MMAKLSCRTIRLWLQAPEELGKYEVQQLSAHLADCAECRHFKAQQEELDTLIQSTLDWATMGVESVRPQVWGRLHSAAPRWRFIRWPTSHRWPTRAMVPLTLVAMLLAIILSQPIPNNAGEVMPVGAAWHLVRPEIAFPLTVDPTKPNHLLAGAWGQVYQSWDGGVSWHRLAPLPADLVVRDLTIDPTDPSRYLVATKHSVFVSNDAGRHWIVAASDLPGAMNMFVLPDPQHPGTFYLGPSILWKSTDHGFTWSWAGPGRVFARGGIQSLSVAANGDLITGIWRGGVAISTDGGRSWQRRARGLAPDVMDVTVGPHDTLWAATDHGVYRSLDFGLHWRRVTVHFWATSIVVRPGYILAAGNGWVYRSTDGGRSWHVAMSGLPLDPYVYELLADPFHPQRVFASLNTDGLYRSDDGGQHWMAIDVGLQLTGHIRPIRFVLFRRDGWLWMTSTKGGEPSSLTVERNIARAALAPDGAAVAYVAAWRGGWAVRVLSAPNSTASAAHLLTALHTLASGTGPSPQRLVWAPNSSLLAIVRAPTVMVVNLARMHYVWKPSLHEHLVGWTSDGSALLFWNSVTGHLNVHPWQVAQRFSSAPQMSTQEAVTKLAIATARSYPASPVLAPDGKHIALLWHQRLYSGSITSGVRVVAVLSSHCQQLAWSDDSMRLLLTCGRAVEERTTDGYLAVWAELPLPVSWLPGSHRTLLFYRGGALWRWNPGGRILRFVDHAAPVPS